MIRRHQIYGSEVEDTFGGSGTPPSDMTEISGTWEEAGGEFRSDDTTNNTAQEAYYNAASFLSGVALKTSVHGGSAQQVVGWGDGTAGLLGVGAGFFGGGLSGYDTIQTAGSLDFLDRSVGTEIGCVVFGNEAYGFDTTHVSNDSDFTELEGAQILSAYIFGIASATTWDGASRVHFYLFPLSGNATDEDGFQWVRMKPAAPFNAAALIQ